MKNLSKIFFLLMVLFLGSYGFASALSLGTNITIYDNEGSGTGWNGQQEDQEVEPGNVTDQRWDLEGFFLNSNILTMVGGYDFFNGVSPYSSGDIFIDINGDAVYGAGTAFGLDGLSTDGNSSIKNKYGYDYVLDLDFNARTFNVYAISIDTLLTSVYYRSNDGANAWQYVPGSGSQSVYSGILSLNNINAYSDISGFSGTGPYTASVSLGFLEHATEFTAHFTMGCGNDNLMGKGIVTPEPATMVLFGIGLIGLAGIGRKKLKK